MSMHDLMDMTDGEIVGYVMALPDASELSHMLAQRLRVQTKLRSDADMRERLAQERIYRLEREVRELKTLMDKE